MYHPPSYNTYTLKGLPTPTSYPQPTGCTIHNLTTLIHSMDPPLPTPLPQTHRKYYPPSCNIHALKGPPATQPPTLNPQEVPPTILQHSYTKGTPCPPPPTPNPQEVPPTILQHSYTKGTPNPLPPTHRKYHPPSYNTRTLKGPTSPPSSPQPTGSTTHHLTTLIH